MIEITEDYVSFEIAKLLKEKGFDEECACLYDDVELGTPGLEVNGYIRSINSSLDDNQYAAPTLQMAMKWLREVHNIHIELNWDKGNQLYSFQIWKPRKYQPEISSLDLWRIYKDDNYPGEWKYEEACEIAIKYCLKNLI